MDVIGVSILIVCICGLVAGAVLALSSRAFAVKVDPRIEKIEAVLPGANCSGCGLPSCFLYASHIVNDDAEPNQCVQLREDAVCEIGRLLGREVAVRQRQVAAIRCYGSPRSNKLFTYGGFQSCRVASYYSSGGNACLYNCMSLGDCFNSCPFDAITHTPGRIPRIDPALCTGCGKCVRECPSQIIRLVPENARPHIACNSRDKGAVVNKICPVGCISCQKCVKTCPQQAISYTDGLIEIDYARCNSCGECIPVCPRSIIVDLSTPNKEDSLLQ